MNNPIFKLCEKYDVRIEISYVAEVSCYKIRVAKAHIYFDNMIIMNLPVVTEEVIYEHIEKTMIPPVLDNFEKWNHARIEKMKEGFNYE